MYHPAMAQPEQTYKNHVRRDPVYGLAVIVLLINFIVVTVQAIRTDLETFRAITLLWIAVAAALVVIAVKARTYALKAQDRVIRLEERLRYAMLLPPTLYARTTPLTEPQIVALRFATDAELPALIERTLNENLDPKQIKQAITTWRPDHFRI